MKREMVTKGQRKGIVVRILRTMRQFFPRMFVLCVVLIVFNAVVSSIPALFMQNVIALIEGSWQTGDWALAGPQILSVVMVLVAFYALSLLSGVAYNQMMAVMTQGTLKRLRVMMFERMQKLPISYFDTHNHGEIMSHYTNDIDTLRQMISQSFPQMLASSVMVMTILCIMLYLCLWLTLVIIAGVAVMTVIVRRVGGGSAKYFVRQQGSLAEVEGYVEEMMYGQKVVKVFCRERASQREFDHINAQLFSEAEKANKYANTLGPILNNVGNVLYVIVAVTGGMLLLSGARNVSLSGLTMGISVVVPFLNMTRQFAGNINQVSHQINAVVMGLAGAQRIFRLLDEQAEPDQGDVELTCTRPGEWAWRLPGRDGRQAEYVKLAGDVRMEGVDFAYQPGKDVLHDITLFAKPGQKVAFVGATGAGKTTIANLLNRFYDIGDGKIRYDGININRIKKADLRQALGIVLQDTNLFTGSVMDNIRYGRLDATNDECVAAAKLSGADDFISRLPDGYQTQISGNNDNLSQGQRQLLSIARVAVADPPVMILDEATSSIDTRTEAIVQRGMDALMKNRTVFVIAHRLSTVKNADVIMVLDAGRIIERGTHQQLLAQRGQYHQLYTGAFELE